MCEPIISDFVASENYACKHLGFSGAAATAPLLKLILHNKCNLYKWKLQNYQNHYLGFLSFLENNSL